MLPAIVAGESAARAVRRERWKVRQLLLPEPPPLEPELPPRLRDEELEDRERVEVPVLLRDEPPVDRERDEPPAAEEPERELDPLRALDLARLVPPERLLDPPDLERLDPPEDERLRPLPLLLPPLLLDLAMVLLH